MATDEQMMLSDEEYMKMAEEGHSCNDADPDIAQKMDRYEQHTMFNKNVKAVMQAINDQNTRLAEFQKQLVAVTAQVSMLNTGLDQLKKIQMNELIAKMGTGSTVHLEDS